MRHVIKVSTEPTTGECHNELAEVFSFSTNECTNEKLKTNVKMHGEHNVKLISRSVSMSLISR
jgi:hypothetical protein